MSWINMNGGNELKLWCIMLLAVWIWWTGVQSQMTSSTCKGDTKFLGLNYPNVNFTLPAYSTDDYQQMIASLRQLLTRHGSYRQGIRMLREAEYVPDSERYVLLTISVEGQAAAIFAIDVTNVYIVGYLIGNTRYFFEEAPDRADQLLFVDAATTSPTRRSSNYVSLEHRAGSRARIYLGLPNMEHAIRTLVTDGPEDASSLLVVIQMVAEGVRYWEIEWYTLRIPIDQSFLPSGRMLDFENNWGALSEQIQISEVFAFERPINIGGHIVDNVQSAIVSALFLMLFRCRQPHPHLAWSDPGEGTCIRLIDPPTKIMGRDGSCLDPHLQLQAIVSSHLEEDDDTCKHVVDPRSRIQGRDGLCVEVEGFMYGDDNAVVISPCKSSDFRNQLWNFQRDGKIVSMEKCLATSGDTPGSNVMIHECDTLHDSAVQWAMDDYGTLTNIYSGLVLTASSGVSKQLILESNSDSSFQAWKSTNNTRAVDVYIRGENNQCIYYDGKYGVYTETCRQDYPWHKWRLYPDSTIRPIKWLDGCLELASLELSLRGYNYIEAGYCSSYPEYHRWIFTHDGSIMNLKSKLVVDADVDYPEYLKAAPYKGGRNQIWMLEFI